MNELVLVADLSARGRSLKDKVWWPSPTWSSSSSGPFKRSLGEDPEKPFYDLEDVPLADVRPHAGAADGGEKGNPRYRKQALFQITVIRPPLRDEVFLLGPLVFDGSVDGVRGGEPGGDGVERFPLARPFFLQQGVSEPQRLRFDARGVHPVQ